MKRKDLIKMIRRLDRECVEKGVFKRSMLPHEKGYENRKHEDLEKLATLLLQELNYKSTGPTYLECENLELRKAMRSLQ